MKKQIILVAVLVLLPVFCLNVFAQTKTYPFEVVKSGKGKQAILFLPGFACSGDVWNDTKIDFENEYTCYTLTMAGFAEVKSQPNVTFKNWETEIYNYIKDNKIEKPILIGHSMGGVLALAIAADYPEIISKIVVVDALPSLTALSNPTFKSIVNNDCLPMTTSIMEMSDTQFNAMQKSMLQRLLEDASKMDLVMDWSMKSDRKTFAEMYCDFSNTDLRDKIATIKCPSLILLEAYFVNLKPAIEEQYKRLKTAQFQYANKGLHFIMFDDKEWYLKQLSNFIKFK